MLEEFEIETKPTTPLTDVECESVVEELIEDPTTPNAEIIEVEDVIISKIRILENINNGKKVNALKYTFDNGTNLVHYHQDNSWMTQVYKVDGKNVDMRPIKSNRAPLDKLSEQLFRGIVKELIHCEVVNKPRKGLKIMDEISININNDDREWLNEKAYTDCNIERSEWFFIDGKKSKFNGEAVANYIISTFKASFKSNIYTMSDAKCLYVYDNGIYRDGEDDIITKIREVLGQYANIHYVTETLGSIKYKTLIERSQFNKPNGDLNLSNGVFNYITQTFRPHHSDDLFTYSLKIDYDPDATCPNIDRYFGWALPKKKDTLMVLEELSYCFVSGYPIQRLFFWFGDGYNGKTTIMNMIIEMIGRENVTGYTIQELENNKNYSQANLYGKKINSCGDLPSTKTSLDFLKSATGGDTRTVRTIWGKPFNLLNEAKFFFAMNEIPEILDFSDGPMRRIIITSFESNVIDDGALPDEVMEMLYDPDELSGLFNKLMSILPDLMERGDFSNALSPDELRKQINSLKGYDVHEFVRAKTTDALDTSSIPLTVLHTLYSQWCEISGYEVKNLKMFRKHMRGYGKVESQLGDIIVYKGMTLT